jgi:N-acetylglucosaminyldiphosphoundecaprenol N-acetyl-beta-D-mannosaminyltransferase
MRKPKQISLLGVRVDSVTMPETLNIIEGFIKEGKPRQVITLNAEMVHHAWQDPALKEVIQEAHLVTPDGFGVVWAARKLKNPVPERVTGIDLVQALLPLAAQKGWSLYFYGGKPGVAAEAAQQAKNKHPGLQIAGTSHGYLSPAEETEMLSTIKAAKPQLLLVALGAPRQEFWIRQHLAELNVPVAIGVGGTLDVLSGQVKRAPALFQRLRLEWLYRLLKDPRRARRFLALPKFALTIFWNSREF